MPLSREFKVGFFVVCTAAMIVAALVVLAVGKGIFETGHTFTVSSKSGDGFTEGMPVVFSGFVIGKVHALELNDQGMVLIKIRIPNRHVKWIRSDSGFILYRPLIGAARIVVNTDNLQSPALSEDRLPEVTVVNDINDAIARIEPMLDRLTQIADNVERLTRNLADPKGDLHKTLGHAEKITANLAGKKSLLEMAVSDEDSIRSVHEALRKLDKTMTRLDTLLGKTDAQLYGREGILPQMNDILKDVLQKLRKIDATIDHLNRISAETSEGVKDFRILRSDIDDAVRAIDDLAQKIDGVVGSKKPPELKTP